MKLQGSVRTIRLVTALLACAGCESDGSSGDASAAHDATTAPNEGGLDASDPPAGHDGSTAGTGGSGGSSADAGGERDAADDAASFDGSSPDASAPDASTAPRVTHVYVGGYSSDIAHFVLDRATGELDHRGATDGGNAPSYLAVHPLHDALYAVNEQDSSAASQILAFAIDPQDGDLSMINAVPSGGEGAPHLAVHPTGDWIGVAHYDSGHTSILPVRADRGLGGVTDVDRGPADGARKAHQIVFDARGTTLLVPCLENNYVLQYQFNLGALVLNAPPTTAVEGGPRHMALSPDQRYAYVLSELDSTITSFLYDGIQGRLSSPQTIDSEDVTKGESAHIAVHPNGQWLYASNRVENSVGVFSIDSEGRPHAVEFVRAGLATPRDFAIDPFGEYLLVANQGGAQDVHVYRIAAADGRLTFASSANVGGQPSSVAFALLEAAP
jgi:6-phosphogluconolactonase